MIEQRQIQLRLISLGQYSKALVLPRWWVKLKDDPEIVKLSLSLSFIGVEPVKKEEAQKEGAASAKRR